MNSRVRSFALVLVLAITVVSGCVGQVVSPQSAVATSIPNTSIEEQAAQEATAIIARARATAMVLQAQAEATSVMQQAITVEAVQAETIKQTEQSTPALSIADASQTPDPSSEPSSVPDDEYRIELMDVGYAGEGGFIIVRFKATRKAADDLWPGRVSVTDEVTGTVYEEVPLMPTIGLLISRPRTFGPAGYVMLYNIAPGLPEDALVTVKLGKFTQEHVPVTK